MPGDWLQRGEETEASVVVYRGTPKNKGQGGELSAWRTFCEWFCPWLNKKRQLGDDYLEAKVLNELASAMVKLSETKERLAIARKTAAETAEIASRLDVEKLAKLRRVLETDTASVGCSDQRVDELFSQLETKLANARLRYGTRILPVEDPKTQQEGDSIPPVG